MSWSVRAIVGAAFIALASFSAAAADKPFQRDDLADAAIRLEAKIKADSGTVAKPVAALKREADTAFQRNDARNGMLLLGQIATLAPNDAANWLRLFIWLGAGLLIYFFYGRHHSILGKNLREALAHKPI